MSKGSGGTRGRGANSSAPVSINMNQLEDKIVEYVRDNYSGFSDEEKRYMEQNFKKANEPLYRVVDNYHGEYDLNVGDTLNLDRLSSFSEGLRGFGSTLSIRDYVGISGSDVVLKVEGGKGYNISSVVTSNANEFGPYGRSYTRQNEVLSKGSFFVKSVSTSTYKDERGNVHTLKTITLKQK